MFPCSQCGECCRHVGDTALAEDMALPNGCCRYLNEENNLCTIYATRPLFCNVDKSYEIYYKSIMSKLDYYKKNIEVCSKLQGKGSL